VVTHKLMDDGTYPNNERLPLLVYVGVLRLPERNPAATVEAVFQANRWGSSWRNGVYSFHHYHSTAHEVLGIYAGTARVQFGGEDGPVFTVEPGDVVIIPAGVAHKSLGASGDFRCVGAYPRGQRPDMNYGETGDRPRADERIAQVPLPASDPVHGIGGPLVEHWLVP
jgi:uncharacterized protein YjlB